MILFLCSEPNYDLLNFSDNIPVKKLSGNRSLKKFVINDATNFSAYSYFIVDLNSLTDTEDEIVDAIMGFKAMYDATIIILADERDELLSKLYDAGVRYFITAAGPEEIQEEILNCISQNRTNPSKGQKELKINSLSNSSDINENVTEKNSKPNEDGIKVEEATKQRKVDNKSQKKEHLNNKKSKVIAVAGTSNNTGTTTTALNLAHFLTNTGKVSYICSSLSSLFPDIENKEFNGFLEHKGVKCYSKDGNLDLSEHDFIIMDLDVLERDNLKPFLNADVRIICTTMMRNNLDKLPEFLKLVDGHTSNFIFSFVPPGAQEQLSKLVDGHQVYFSEYSPNMFDGNVNKAMWHKIMNIQDRKKITREPMVLQNVDISSSKKIGNDDMQENLGTGVLDKIKKTSEEIKNSFHVPKINKSEFRKKTINKTSHITRVIAVAGAAPSLGCTHNALAMAFFFSNLKYKVALVELGESHDLLIVGSLPNAKQKNEHCYTINGFDVFPSNFCEQPIKLDAVLKKGYDVAIFDLGVLKHGDSPNNAYYEMIRADISVLVASSSLWRWKDLRPFIDNTEMELWNLVIAGDLNAKELQKCIENKVYCMPWSDPLVINTARDGVYETLFEPLLIQMQMAENVQLTRRPTKPNNINRDTTFINFDDETVMINQAVIDKATTPDEHRRQT